MIPYQGFSKPPVDILPAPTGAASAATVSGDAPRRKRTRAKRSCDMCRKKKSKCDAEVNQPCTNCKNWKTECVFLVEQKRRGPSTGYVELLESRLKRMESLIENLARSNGKPQSLDEDTAGITPPPSTDETSTASQASVDDQYDTATDRLASITESSTLTPESDSHSGNMEDQMNGLQIEDYGSICYMGSSSGIHLIERHFMKGQKVRFPGEKITYVHKVNDDDAENIIVKTEVLTAEDIEATQQQPIDVTVQQDEENLFQDKALTDRLVNIFFDKIYVYSPFINKAQFMQQYHSNCPNSPDEYLLAAICGVGARFLPEEIVYSKERANGSGTELIHRKSTEVASFFRIKAHSVLDIAPKRSRISTLQTLLLLTMYFDHEHNNEDNSMRWFVAGMAIRMAQDLALHRSATRWNIPKSEIELRRRLWYATYVMDRWVSAELGRPVAILDHDFDVELPSLYDMEIQELSPCGTSSSKSSVAESPASDESNISQLPLYVTFIHFIKLTQILGQVLQGLHSPRARSLCRRNESLVCFLDGALVRWKLNLPAELEFDSVTNASPYRGSVQMCYNLVLLLLHRPASTDTIEKSNTAFQSLSICTNAANNILCIAESLTADDFLRSPWNITVYTIVQASLIFLHHAKGDNHQLKQCGFNSLLRCIRLFKRKEFCVSTFETDQVLHLLVALVAIALDRSDAAGRMLAGPDDELARKFAEEVDNMVILPSSCLSDVNIGKERSKRAAAAAPFAQNKRPRPIPLQGAALMDMLNASESADSTMFNSPNNFGSLLYSAAQPVEKLDGLEQAAIMTAPSESVLFGGTGLEPNDSFSIMEGLMNPNLPSPKLQNQPGSLVSTELMDRQVQLPNYAYMSELHAPEDDTQGPQDIIQQLFQNPRIPSANGDINDDPTLSLLNSEIALWEAPSSMTWNDWDQYVSSMASSQQPDLPVTSL